MLRSAPLAICQEFRTPLASSLMQLESLLLENNQLSPCLQETVWLAVKQLNLLLCLVNNVIDQRMIEKKMF